LTNQIQEEELFFLIFVIHQITTTFVSLICWHVSKSFIRNCSKEGSSGC